MDDILDFGNIYPSVLNGLIITLTAIVGIALVKYFSVTWGIPGLADLMTGTFGG